MTVTYPSFTEVVALVRGSHAPDVLLSLLESKAILRVISFEGLGHRKNGQHTLWHCSVYFADLQLFLGGVTVSMVRTHVVYSHHGSLYARRYTARYLGCK